MPCPERTPTCCPAVQGAGRFGARSQVGFEGLLPCYRPWIERSFSKGREHLSFRYGFISDKNGRICKNIWANYITPPCNRSATFCGGYVTRVGLIKSARTLRAVCLRSSASRPLPAHRQNPQDWTAVFFVALSCV